MVSYLNGDTESDDPAYDLLVWLCPRAASKAILTTAGSNILTSEDLDSTVERYGWV